MVQNYVKKAKPYNDDTLKLTLEEITSGAIKEASSIAIVNCPHTDHKMPHFKNAVVSLILT